MRANDTTPSRLVHYVNCRIFTNQPKQNGRKISVLRILLVLRIMMDTQTKHTLSLSPMLMVVMILITLSITITHFSFRFRFDFLFQNQKTSSFGTRTNCFTKYHDGFFADNFRLQWVKLNRFHHRMAAAAAVVVVTAATSTTCVCVCVWFFRLFSVAIAFGITVLHIPTHAHTIIHIFSNTWKNCTLFSRLHSEQKYQFNEINFMLLTGTSGGGGAAAVAICCFLLFCIQVYLW